MVNSGLKFLRLTEFCPLNLPREAVSSDSPTRLEMDIRIQGRRETLQRLQPYSHRRKTHLPRKKDYLLGSLESSIHLPNRRSFSAILLRTGGGEAGSDGGAKRMGVLDDRRRSADSFAIYESPTFLFVTGIRIT